MTKGKQQIGKQKVKNIKVLDFRESGTNAIAKIAMSTSAVSSLDRVWSFLTRGRRKDYFVSSIYIFIILLNE